MSMSHDRVKFYLDHQYLRTNGIGGVLKESFGMDNNDVTDMCQAAGIRPHRLSYESWGGVWIVCRPSQFARFLIYRDEAGIKNGFKDLKPELFVPEPKLSVYEKMADKLKTGTEDVKDFCDVLGITEEYATDLYNRKPESKKSKEIDVSLNKARS